VVRDRLRVRHRPEREAAGSFTACGLKMRSVVTLSTCTITMPPEFLTAWAMERFSSVRVSLSMVTIRPSNLRDSESSKICYHPYGWRGADKLSETEKITINLGLVDLGQIDLLVQEGFYQNRTDFIRTAIRNQLNAHADAVKQTVARKELVLGLQHYARRDLEAVREAGETLEIRVLGLATIADDVSPELARETIAAIDVLGAFRASPEVKAALAGRIRST
jgi:Arc/MetJ-type ribon-helix-helix transcriptional regulator